MKKLNQLFIIETDTSSAPLLSEYQPLLQAFSEAPVVVKFLSDVIRSEFSKAPPLVLLHSNLTSIQHLQQFIELQAVLSYSSIVIVSDQQDEELCLLALEAGVEDSITKPFFTASYMRKAILRGLRRSHIKKEMAQSKEQLLACIQNTPNVAVQWYSSKGEVLFWNRASERIFGWKAEEAVGKTIDQLLYTLEDADFWLSKIEYMTLTKKPGEPVEWLFRYRDGSEGCCISTLFPIPSYSQEQWFVCMDVEITARKQMEMALQESEERYHTLFNEAADAIFINDVNGRFLDVNRQACDMLNYTKEQLLQLQVKDLFSTEELVLRPIMVDELMAGHRTSIERMMLTASGEAVPVEITAQKFKDRIMAIVRNISDRKKVEQALIQSEEKYRSLVEHQADAMIVFDEKGIILDVNSSAVQLLQYTRDEFHQLTITDLISPGQLKQDPVRFDLLKNGESTISQRKMLRKDGWFVETEVHAKKLYEGFFLASVRDLTERIEVQHRLEKEIELSDSIINSLPGMFYLFKKDGGFLRWNKQLQIISGYSADEISKMSPLDFVDGEDVNLVSAAVEKAFKTGQSSVEVTLLTKDGREIPFYFTGIAINYGGTECLLGTGIDISAVKNLEKELAQQKIAGQKKIMQAMIDAEEKEKNKLGLELHDNISQILSVVRMYLAILDSSQVLEGVTLSQTIRLLNTAMEEIRTLSHSLAVSYKFEAGLTEALEDMVEKIKLARDFSIDLLTPPDLDEHTTNNQKLAIYRIVQEQLNNISKHSKATEVEVQIGLVNEELVLEIRDNGKGFNSLNASKGLGLNTITNRVEALGGNVSIDSAPGEGCRVIAHIPLQLAVQ